MTITLSISFCSTISTLGNRFLKVSATIFISGPQFWKPFRIVSGGFVNTCFYCYVVYWSNLKDSVGPWGTFTIVRFVPIPFDVNSTKNYTFKVPATATRSWIEFIFRILKF